MHRPHTLPNPHAPGHLPPFGAVGWLVTILSDADRRRDIRPKPDDWPAAPLGDVGLTESGIDVARPRKLGSHIASLLGTAIGRRCGAGRTCPDAERRMEKGRQAAPLPSFRRNE